MSPILDIQRRHRELGRIRMGEKGPKGQPVKLTTWRLTSANRLLLDEAASLWGGEVREWEGSPTGGQWELATQTPELPIIIPPGRDPVSQWMEQWTKGGCTHRCDGERNTITDLPCSCDMTNPVCKPTTRLSVMLPDLPDVGVWRLESHGWNAAAELPGTIALIQAAAEQGRFLEGRLRIEERRQVREGKTKQFIVPALDIGVTVRELTSGHGGEIAAPATGVIEAPTRVGLPAPGDHKARARELIQIAGDSHRLAEALAEVGIGSRDLADDQVHERAMAVASMVAETRHPAGDESPETVDTAEQQAFAGDEPAWHGDPDQ